LKKTRYAQLIFSIAAFLVVFSCFAETSFAQTKPYVEGEVVVLMSSSGASGASAAVSAAEAVGASLKKTFKAAGGSGASISVLKSETLTTEELLEKLKGHPDILGAEPNMVVRASYTTRATKSRFSNGAASADVVPDDPYYESGHMWGLDQMNLPAAWSETTGSNDVFVAVVDTGIERTHADLADNIGTDADGGWGINAYSDTPGEDPADDHGHGTHVAGIIGAVGNNALGIPGVCWNVSLLAVKTLGGENAEGTSDMIIAGIDYILDQKQKGVPIVAANFSLGAWWDEDSDETTSPYAMAFKALSDAGILILAASGNEYQDMDNPGGAGTNPSEPDESYTGKKHWPSSMTRVENKISVGAVGQDGNMAAFSNWSPTKVDIAAPGVDIWSSVRNDDYEALQGTSMATPYVTGLAALYKSKNPTVGASAIKALLLSKLVEKPSIEGKVANAGIPDAEALLSSGTDPVTGVSLDRESAEIGVSETLQLTASVAPASAGNTNVSWETSDAAVATVENGLVTGIANGEADIVVRTEEGDFTATCAIVVSGDIPVPTPDPDNPDNPSDPWTGKEGCSATGGGASSLLLALPLLFAAGFGFRKKR